MRHALWMRAARGLGSTLAVALCGALVGALSGLATLAVAAPLPDVDALVSFETRHVLASGITRVDTWQERLVRRDGQVWVERVLPAGGAAHRDDDDAHAGHVGHAHFNADTAARWLAREPDGEMTVRFVDRGHRAIVSIPRAEYGTVNFDGSYDAAASIVPAEVARRMKPGALQGDARWLADRRDGWSHRVLWSESRQLALRVESRSDDGAISRIVEVRPQTARGAAPWTQLDGYEHKRYDDYMD